MQKAVKTKARKIEVGKTEKKRQKGKRRGKMEIERIEEEKEKTK